MANSKADVLLDNLIGPDKIKRVLRAKKSPYIYKTIKKNRLKEHEEEGWEIDRPTVHSYRVKKKKPHNQFFEDRIWCLLAKLDFDHMNKDRNFKIPHSSHPEISPKQIDVFAGNREAVLIVECKSAAKQQRKDFQKDIAEIKDIKRGITDSVRKHFSSKPKIAWLFATSNCLVSRPDHARMDDGGIVHFTEDDIEYYEKLTGLLGPVAKYQLFGRLFGGQGIPELDPAVPAIKGRIGKFRYYSFSIEPEKLLKICFVLHRTDSSGDAFETYQRMVSKSRIKDIEKYIDDPDGHGTGFFPNAIIININSKRPLRFDPAKSAEHSSGSQIGMLYLPKQYHSAFIIDGQHRLYGYGRSKWKSKHTIPVVAFEKLPQEVQTKLFVDINHKQKSVPTNLLLTLMADFGWGSEHEDEAIAALKIRLIKQLNADRQSPLYRRIILTQESKTPTRCLTLNYLRGQAINKTNFFGVVERRELKKKGYFSEDCYDKTLQKGLDFLIPCFDFFRTMLPDQWDKGSAGGGFIAVNLGISATIRILDDILKFLVKSKGLKPSRLSGEELGKAVQPYLVPVAKFVDGLGFEGTRKLRGYVGGAAVEKVLWEFRIAINEKYQDFSPEGLEKWKKERSGVYTTETKILLDEIQLKMRDKIFEVLKLEYGENGWWNDGVSTEIQTKCSAMAIAEHRIEPDWSYAYLVDYQNIIDKKSNLKDKQSRKLIDFVKPPGKDNSGKKDQLKWIGKLNKIRNRISHPERESATEEERDYVRNVHAWFCARD